MASHGDINPIVHSHDEMGVIAEKDLDRLKLGNEEDSAMEEDFDQYLGEEQIICDQVPIALSDLNPEMLNEKQSSI